MVDTRELSRRPGSMKRVQLTVPAPARLGIDVLAVPEGDPVELDLRLEAVMEGILVSGTATATLVGECGRCLDTIAEPTVHDLQQLYVYPEARSSSEPDDDELPTLAGDLLDLEPALRDAVVLDLPLTPLCDPDCAGLCPQCGVRLDDVEPDHAHDVLDARWAALAALAAPQAALDRSQPSTP